ncbi:hypothetical protein AKJ09_03412 [Labilithrix luteola]|uniref:Uncharacterized protein n=1 Tax=Labilithrix luteola TaxID=1391654 RepID=A0A0K1PT89_9BACT|nr:hypothetical protein AKJ09_03412 [Labilithrix luteola]
MTVLRRNGGSGQILRCATLMQARERLVIRARKASRQRSQRSPK